MTRDEIEEEILSFIATHFELEREQVRPSSRFYDDLGLDSIDAVNLALHLGTLTDQSIDEATLRTIVTVADVVNLTVKLKAAESSEAR